MFKGVAVPEGSPEDLNTRARIREAAMTIFGEQGFGVGVRAIAAAAGVSPGLVNHHFGSKDGLRQACDDHVREFIRRAKMDYMSNPSPKGLLQALAEVEEFAPYLAYLMRSLQTGGPLALELFEHMIADVEAYLKVGIENGSLRAPLDLKATARFMGLQNGGGFLLFMQLYLARHDGVPDYPKMLREYTDVMMLPAIELYTNGLLTDSMALDTLLSERETTEAQHISPTNQSGAEG
ncbi:TetR/AcrR family transcriptional regulator [Nocardia miyunensis]|uniref:TetR/AcrR family transcriptional regulator n=1 Tax=Nocardia miyunensis TaxID=282684 RepID=UPI0008327750|nr:TetR family transcriptional regulator [Nocardia miyunensis]